MPLLSLREARKTLNYTQSELAALVGITPASISNYEIGRSEPGQEIKHRIEAVLGQTIDWEASKMSIYMQAFRKVLEDSELGDALKWMAKKFQEKQVSDEKLFSPEMQRRIDKQKEKEE